jgi:hypothetical protein
MLTVKLNDSTNLSSGKYNLGLTFLNLKKSDSCLFYLQQAAVLAEKNHQTITLFTSMAPWQIVIF